MISKTLSDGIKTKCLRCLGSVGSPRMDSCSSGGSYILCGHGYCCAGRILVCAMMDGRWLVTQWLVQRWGCVGDKRVDVWKFDVLFLRKPCRIFWARGYVHLMPICGWSGCWLVGFGGGFASLRLQSRESQVSTGRVDAYYPFKYLWLSSFRWKTHKFGACMDLWLIML
jgi:hypothetical protein